MIQGNRKFEELLTVSFENESIKHLIPAISLTLVSSLDKSTVKTGIFPGEWPKPGASYTEINLLRVSNEGNRKPISIQIFVVKY